jgi:hypothetical protein
MKKPKEEIRVNAITDNNNEVVSTRKMNGENQIETICSSVFCDKRKLLLKGNVNGLIEFTDLGKFINLGKLLMFTNWKAWLK